MLNSFEHFEYLPKNLTAEQNCNVNEVLYEEVDQVEIKVNLDVKPEIFPEYFSSNDIKPDFDPLQINPTDGIANNLDYESNAAGESLSEEEKGEIVETEESILGI